MTDTNGNTGLAKRTPDQLAKFHGTHTDAAKTSALLRDAADHYNLVSPAPAVAQVPEGCAVSLAAVMVDYELDTYPIPGGSKKGLGKAALDRIGLAIGLRPVPSECVRIDDGSHPYYCHFRWVGQYRQFDGTVAPAFGEKKMDLREGSAAVENMRRIAAAKGKTADNELAQMRAFIIEHAETKARLRAIRSLGVKTSYTAEELAKPFVCARLSYTGDFKDEDVRRHAQKSLADSFVGGTHALYGGGPRPSPTLHAMPDAAPSHRLPPPPIESSAAEDVSHDDAPRGEASSSARSEPSPANRAPSQVRVRHAEGSDNVRMPGKKGGMVADAEYDDLVYWRGKVADGLKKDPNGQYASRNREQLKMIEAEIAARDATDDDDEPKMADAEVRDTTPQGKAEAPRGVAHEGAKAGSGTPAGAPASSAPPEDATQYVIPKGRAGEGKKFADAGDDQLIAYESELTTWLESDQAKTASEDVVGRCKARKKALGALIQERMEKTAPY